MGASGFERSPGERGFWAHGLVDPLNLRRVDITPASCSEESGFMGRNPDWLNHQRTIEEFHDIRHVADVRIRILYRRYRSPCNLRFV